MIRTKGQFYWIDALYLSKGRDDLVLRGREADLETYQCKHCGAFITYQSTAREGGQWQRLRPYSQYRLTVTYGEIQEKKLTVLQAYDGKELCQCETCASHWWKDKQGWTKADDAMIDHSKK